MPEPAGRSSSALHTAVLYADYGSAASYYDDWQDAFRTSPHFACRHFNVVRGSDRRALAGAVGEFELIVMLHSLLADSLTYAERVRGTLAARHGKLLAFVGNEVNLPSAPMAPKIDLLAAIRPEFVATQLLVEAGRYLYEGTGAQVISVPHALNPAAFRPEVPVPERPIDIGGRSFRYMPHLGDDDRNRLYEMFAEHRFDPGLRVDLSTDVRLNREGWARFLNRCRGTVATEAGSWYLEPDDATIRRIQAWQAGQISDGRHVVIGRDSRLRQVAHRLPWPVKQRLRRWLRRGPLRYEASLAEDADYETVRRLFFVDTPRAPVYAKAVSSRHFDAVGTKTCQILIRGRYNDILKADEHYVALDADFGNLEEVMARFRDDGYVQGMVDEAYDYVMDAHTHAHRLATIHQVLDRGADDRR